MNRRFVLLIVALIMVVLGVISLIPPSVPPPPIEAKVEYARAVQPIQALNPIPAAAVKAVTTTVEGALPVNALDGKIVIEDIQPGEYVTGDKAVSPDWFLDPRNQAKIREKFGLEPQSFLGAFPDWLIGKLRPGHRVNVYVTLGNASPIQDLVAFDVLVIDVATSAGGLVAAAEPGRPTPTPAPGSPPTPASIVTILAEPPTNWQLREYLAKGYRPWVTLSTAQPWTPTPTPTPTNTPTPPGPTATPTPTPTNTPTPPGPTATPVIHLTLQNAPFKWQFDILSPERILAEDIRAAGETYKRDFPGPELTLRVKNVGDPRAVYWIERINTDDRAEVFTDKDPTKRVTLKLGQRINFEPDEEGNIIIRLVGGATEAMVELLDAGDEGEVK